MLCYVIKTASGRTATSMVLTQRVNARSVIVLQSCIGHCHVLYTPEPSYTHERRDRTLESQSGSVPQSTVSQQPSTTSTTSRRIAVVFPLEDSLQRCLYLSLLGVLVDDLEAELV